MNKIKKYKEYNKVGEDKIYKFSEYNPTKYNGNIIVDQIMEWLRAKLLDNDKNEIIVTKEQFFNECSADKDKFMTFYNEMDKTGVAKNFKIKINDDKITFYDFKNNEKNNEEK